MNGWQASVLVAPKHRTSVGPDSDAQVCPVLPGPLGGGWQ
jgi:hypothetical protein